MFGNEGFPYSWRVSAIFIYILHDNNILKTNVISYVGQLVSYSGIWIYPKIIYVGQLVIGIFVLVETSAQFSIQTSEADLMLA